MTALSLFEQCALLATLLLLAGFPAAWALSAAPAAWRHFLWTVLFAGILLLPCAIRLAPKWAIAAAPVFAGPAADTASIESLTVSAAAPRQSWNPLLLVWLAGCAIFAIRLGFGRIRVAALRRGAAPADHARPILDAAGGQSIPVVESRFATTPLAAGILRPSVILPVGTREWPAERLRAALLHELMHIERHDLAAQAIAQIACALYWFHPLAWMAASRLRREREQACDDAVLGRGFGAHDYAGYLVESVRGLRGRSSDALAMAEPSLLEVRVLALLDRSRDRRPLNRPAAVAILAAVAIALLPLAVVTVHAQSEPASALAPTATAEPAPQAAATSSLSGTVQDPSGARVPGCQVKATNVTGSNEEVTTTSQADGSFTFASIPAGQYSLQFTSPGFKQLTLRSVAISTGTPSTVNSRLTLGDVAEAVTVSAARPSGAPAVAAAASNRIRVGGMVQPAKLLYKVPPVYPDDLKAKGVTGTVHLAGLISKQGFLDELRVLNTDVDPELAAAAREAASHWLYQPSLLNGEPVSVLTNIDITFQLVQ